MTNPVHYAGDDLIIKVPVSFDRGAPFTNLTGAAIEARAALAAANHAAVSATIAGNEITLVWAKNTFTIGTWAFQVRATKAGRTKTVAAFSIDVQASL